MGYYMLNIEADFQIKEANYPAACKALKAFIESRHDLDYVNVTEAVKYCNEGDLIRALAECKWECDEGEDGIDTILPGRTQLGEDHELFKAIAPFVVENSFITMLGEEKEIWRWIFKNGTCIEEQADVVFESTPLYAAVFNWIYDGESGEELLCITTDKAKAQKAMKEQIEKEKKDSWISDVEPKDIGDHDDALYCEDLDEDSWSFFEKGHHCVTHSDITIHKYERKNENA